MSILVTGAAGYIGSITVRKLVESGYSVLGIDNLENGHRQAVDTGIIFKQADLGLINQYEQIFKDYQIEAVIHLAAHALVGESMLNPEKYFTTNIVYGLNLLNTMIKYHVNNIIFSSSSAIYGQAISSPISESHSTSPLNPYGESKLIFEKILRWYKEIYGLNYITLRYFNAAGAYKELGEDHNPETHLIPIILQTAIGKQGNIPIYGADYDTPDGSCIRDYIHVSDIAEAHILALKKINEKPINNTYNLGNNRGYSVFEIINVVRKLTGAAISLNYQPRRLGDPPILIACSDLVKKELGWNPTCSEIENIIETAWVWKKEHPEGYK